MTALHVLRVFTNEDGRHGNLLGVFLDGGSVPAERRQRVAADLGFSETVFVDDPQQARIRIFTPAAEIGFAGHPSVGTAWLLAREGARRIVLRPPAGEVGVRREGPLTFISGRPEWGPRFELSQVPDPAVVEEMRSGSGYFWAWQDEGAGRVRARAFFPDLGIEEDEATGAAAIFLTARLGRPLMITQGQGSILRTRPLGDGFVEVGGGVVHHERRIYELSR
ncbi:MAG TPA: PhzF family phenazine biosynthesis protein [Solirubrobacterales bacterium]|nr:PhzF family phenazine biosynthesis protein [Solirubrobacterales bacterium]